MSEPSFDFPERLRAQLRDAWAQQTSAALSTKLVRERSAILVTGFIINYYLTTDGNVLVEENDLGSGQTRNPSESEEWMVLVLAARRFGIYSLLDHLPSPPEGSSSCPTCSGIRTLLVKNGDGGELEVVCSECDGLGWIKLACATK